MFYEIPLTPEPQRFTITLADVPYAAEVVWNDLDSVWVLNLYNSDDTPLLTGIPMVTGVDLLAQHRHLGIGGSLLVQVLGNPYGLPAYENLGTGARLLFETSE